MGEQDKAPPPPERAAWGPKRVALRPGARAVWCVVAATARAIALEHQVAAGPPPLSTAQMERLAELLEVVLRGLRGQPFNWSEGQRQPWTALLRRAGVELLTETQIKKRDHVLKRGAKAVGRGYFGAPIQRNAELYVFDVQTKRRAG